MGGTHHSVAVDIFSPIKLIVEIPFSQAVSFSVEGVFSADFLRLFSCLTYFSEPAIVGFSSK